jgi:hypothetical protein
VSDLITIDAVTTSALGFWTDEVTGAPRCASPLPKFKGTGLPFIGIYARALGVGVMGTDLRQGIVAVPAAAVQGDPPRRTPPRC